MPAGTKTLTSERDDISPGVCRTYNFIVRVGRDGRAVDAAYGHRIQMGVGALQLMGILAYAEKRIGRFLATVKPGDPEHAPERILSFTHDGEPDLNRDIRPEGLTFFPFNRGYFTVGVKNHAMLQNGIVIEEVDSAAKAICGMAGIPYTEPARRSILRRKW